MASVEIHVEGLGELRAALLAAVGRTEDATRTALVASMDTVKTATQDQLSKTSHPKGTPTPSPPGSPPSLVSGALRGSVTTQGPVGGGGVYVGRLGPTSVYGRIQELGGIAGRGHKARIPARPYLRPALEESKPAIRAIFSAAWSRIFG